jgi:hypothetical protein
MSSSFRAHTCTATSSSESPSKASSSEPRETSETGLWPAARAFTFALASRHAAAELVDGAFDAALQAKALHAEAAHGWMDQCALRAHSRNSSVMDTGGSTRTRLEKKRGLSKPLP